MTTTKFAKINMVTTRIKNSNLIHLLIQGKHVLSFMEKQMDEIQKF